jgi:hypothetical protein
MGPATQLPIGEKSVRNVCVIPIVRMRGASLPPPPPPSISHDFVPWRWGTWTIFTLFSNLKCFFSFTVGVNTELVGERVAVSPTVLVMFVVCCCRLLVEAVCLWPICSVGRIPRVQTVGGYCKGCKVPLTRKVHRTKLPWRNFLIKWKFFEDAEVDVKKVFLLGKNFNHGVNSSLKIEICTWSFDIIWLVIYHEII